MLKVERQILSDDNVEQHQNVNVKDWLLQQKSVSKIIKFPKREQLIKYKISQVMTLPKREGKKTGKNVCC